MKKIFFLITFFCAFVSSSTMLKAQQAYREPVSSFQKGNDDAVITAYPNPTKDYIVVKAVDPSVKIKQVTFYSVLGIQVADFVVNMNAGEIHIEKLRSGKYLMRYVLSNNVQKVTQIVKQ